MSASPNNTRKHWMSVLARAPVAALEQHLQAIETLPEYTVLRGPEIGLVMTRGRAGGAGAAFNLGEMTVTRCTVRDSDGQIGHAYIAGRDPVLALLAARLDAALQNPSRHDRLRDHVVTPLAAAQAGARAATARRAAATQVQFFTMATMRS